MRITTGTALPQIGFTPTDREALRAFLRRGIEAASHVSPAEDASRLVRTLRCNACHDRDDIRSPRAQIIVEETESGLAPEVLPSLTWAGEKLQTRWMEDFIAGRLTERPRPWLKARMPAFPDYAQALAHGLAAQHAISVELKSSLDSSRLRESFVAERDEPDKDLAELGRQLTLKDRGLDCRQCHGVGREEPLGDDRTRIAPGINFSHVRQRLRYDFYQRFVLDPPRYDINSRMPKLAIDGEHTKSLICNGNARVQFDAIWEYIQSCPDKTGTP